MNRKARISIDSQISAVAAARQSASKLHPNRAHTDLLARQLEEAEATLRFVRRHQDTIRSAVSDLQKRGADQ
ncbi:MAG: hypothetical protein JJ926_03910 [Roseitalea sp.]|nr:hypothetical protein [Roseitalea sp.]MBO6951002.1 hypothetical protein [Rhizobiaceae bacterium]MBO6591011.1 hypothetical protein [Roseitalea sp.]MBO6599731.1 hypothetical protein [Roseitalea sp.]MBO6611487.1 hypothetical protein [Roseitalea sp.]